MVCELVDAEKDFEKLQMIVVIRKKDENDEVPYNVTQYFNAFYVFECEFFWDRLDVSYERACKAIQSTIRDSAYYGSKEQVDAINNYKERVGVIRDSNKQVDAKSEAKSYRDYVFRNEFETMNVFEHENNSGSRINLES